MDDRAFDEAVDHLLSQPPENFVGARNALVRSLRAEGPKEEAAAVARWRRPTRTAWALNRLAQADHDVVVALVVAANAVRDKQTAGGVGLRDAMSRLRQATRAATDAAIAAIAPARPSDHADISAALLAVLSDSDALALLAGGRLLEIPESGLGAFASGPEPSRPGRSNAEPAPKRRTPPSAADAARRKARREALQAARDAENQTRAVHERAKAEVDGCDRAMKLAGERLGRARIELADAEVALDAAKDAMASATDAASIATKVLADTECVLAELEATAE